MIRGKKWIKKVQFFDQYWQLMNESKDKWHDTVISLSIHLDLFQNQLMPNSFKFN